MNRTQLVEEVASTAGLDKRQSEAAVMALIDSVIAEAKAGNKVSIFGFGTFTPGARAGRDGRNPRTGEAVKIAARNVVKFKPATAFNEALNTRGAKRSTGKKTAPAKATAAKPTATRTTATRTSATRTPATKTAATRTAATRTAATKTAATKTAATRAAKAGPARSAATKGPARTPAAKAPARTTAAKAPAKTASAKTTRAATATPGKATRTTKATKK